MRPSLDGINARRNTLRQLVDLILHRDEQASSVT
jgi:hypothetical protein